MTTKKSILTAVITVLFLSLLCGCGEKAPKTDEKTFVTSFYPMYVFTKNITNGAENVNVINMTSRQTGCLHDYQLLPSDIKKLEGADAFIINGGGMESFMHKLYESKDDLFVIDSSDGILADESEEKHNEEKHSEEEHEKEEHGHKHEHEHNSHFWTYIPYAEEQIKNITRGLCEADEKNAELYKKNCEAYLKRLSLLDNSIKTAAASLENKKIIITDEAFEYFAEGYGFETVGELHTEHNSAPSAKELKTLCDTAKKENSPIFVTPDSPKGAAETVANETGVSVFELDPMVTGDYNDLSAYEKAFEKNINTLIKASEK